MNKHFKDIESIHDLFNDFNREPDWFIDNPYLEILAPRFFTNTQKLKWSDLPKRVGRLYLEAEIKYTDYDIALQRAKEIVQIINKGSFFPNSPVMMNSERDNQVNLFACHVLSPPRDNTDLSIAEHIHNGCGGIGYDFSEIKNPVETTYMIERETKKLNPNRKRKAHSAVTLSCTHPEIFSFIKMSKNLEITHTNIELDENFFTEIANNNKHARKLLEALTQSIYFTGRPSVSFSAEKHKRSNSKLINNVCGESLLRENESALIGSINLTKFITDGRFDFIEFQKVARLGLRCLDNLHDLQNHASIEVKKNCLESRKIGIGVMGYADTLLLLNIRYGSLESFSFIEELMLTLKSTLISESEHLGKERGYCNSELLLEGVPSRRNASLMAIPANGTLSLIANVSGGIEPIFSYLSKQTIQGTVIHQLQPTVKKLLDRDAIDINIVFQSLINGYRIQEIDAIKPQLKRILVEANELSIDEHILTQATFQQFIDGGISKTVNLPNDATKENIKYALLLAQQNGCTGISLYRNGSLKDQPTQNTTL